MRKNNGVTLVALIITVIILLILAGVSIQALMGENGLLNKAQSAVNKYKEASDEEQKILNDYYSKIMIATNDSSQVTISVKELKDLIDEEIQGEMLKMYPVGSIYTSKEDKDPSTFIGGKWKKIEGGRFLMNADAEHVAGTTVEAGLPNITGKASFMTGTVDKGDGPFTVSRKSSFAHSDATGGYIDLDFDASLSSEVYGSSTTVQPPAYVVNMWERIE